jgi:hypothetical protein
MIHSLYRTEYPLGFRAGLAVLTALREFHHFDESDVVVSGCHRRASESRGENDDNRTGSKQFFPHDPIVSRYEYEISPAIDMDFARSSSLKNYMRADLIGSAQQPKAVRSGDLEFETAELALGGQYLVLSAHSRSLSRSRIAPLRRDLLRTAGDHGCWVAFRYGKATTIFQQIEVGVSLIAGSIPFGLGVAIARRRTYLSQIIV